MLFWMSPEKMKISEDSFNGSELVGVYWTYKVPPVAGKMALVPREVGELPIKKFPPTVAIILLVRFVPIIDTGYISLVSPIGAVKVIPLVLAI